MAGKLWGGRFRGGTDPRFERFSASFRWDARLVPHDLAIDAAHVRALRRCRVLTAADAARLLRALRRLRGDWTRGRLRLDPAAEDVHSAIQQALEALAGAAAGKLHAGRSRNDLVAQSARLYCKEHAETLIRLIGRVQAAIVRKADRVRGVLVPGMTHLQNAQVLSQAHVFLAYAEMLERSKRQLEPALRFADVCVLGSGALAGSTHALDQRLLASELGLSRVTGNSYDVSGDRDFVLSLLLALSFLGVQLSRIAEDLLIAQTKPFALLEIGSAFCTGSSMMPQKKNADFLELLRGLAGPLAGEAVSMLVTLKGLPTSYNRDLQWDKRALFEAVETAEQALEILERAFATVRVDASRARQLVADDSLYATDLADTLVKRGVPFKTAHEQVGRLVRFAEDNRVPLSKLGLDVFRHFAPALDGGVYGLFEASHSVRMKRTAGSTHPRRLAAELARWKRVLRIR